MGLKRRFGGNVNKIRHILGNLLLIIEPTAGRARAVPKISQKWLDSLEIPNKYREKRIKINGKTFITDAYVPETNTVYEFNGDFWHGNPQIYKPDDINVVSKKTFSKLYKQTVEKANLIKKAGYLLISIWEHDFYQNKQKVIIIDVSLNT